MSTATLDPAAMPCAGDTIGKSQSLARDALAASGSETAALDARILVCAATGLAHEDLMRAPERRLGSGAARRLAEFLRRRIGGEPVARIQGFKEFWGRRFQLCDETLVPRPDSEVLVEQALRLLRSSELPATGLIADLGTGSGCLLVSILAECPDIRGIGTDLSLEALVVARRNAQIHDVAGRCLFVKGDFARALGQGLSLIVANPPYIASDEIPLLARDVRCHDPLRALDGGRDGLDAIAALAPQAVRALAPGGRILLEIGQNQHDATVQILSRSGFDINPADALLCDYAGIIRAIYGKKQC